MIASILGDEETGGTGEGGGPGLDIGMDTSLGDDLMLESIDMVALSERLEERYGERVNFAEMIAGMELDELIELTVGRLVDHVVLSLAPAAER
nr:phosphopantetheine-binding protein [Streptomyces marincola]